MEALAPVLFGLAAVVLLSVVVPRVNRRLKPSKTGWDQLFDSPAGTVYLVVIALALVVAIAVTASS